ncbi:MAG: hypothetical protein JWO60_855 [Frankiales bacterium]|nr:hypothetical protein [Frankiales bacterium]
MRAPRLLGAGAAAACLLLTGCSSLEEPSPIVSVVSGGEFVHSEATSYCFDEQDPTKEPGSEGACSFEERAPELLNVRPGEQVGVDVSKQLADTAWIVVLKPQGAGPDGQPPQEQSSGVQDDHYFTFEPGFSGGPVEMQVRSLASSAPDAQVTGVWRFVLAPGD